MEPTGIDERVREIIERLTALEAAEAAQGVWSQEWREMVISELEHINGCIEKLAVENKQALKEHIENCNRSRQDRADISRIWQKWFQWIIMAMLAAISLYLAFRK